MTETRRARHLLDPDDLRRSHLRSQSSRESLTRVQRWVVSILAVTTILHFSGGLALGAAVVDDSRLDARIGLNVLAAVTGILAVLAGRAIHGKKLLSPWLGLGLLPGLAGAVATFVL